MSAKEPYVHMYLRTYIFQRALYVCKRALYICIAIQQIDPFHLGSANAAHHGTKKRKSSRVQKLIKKEHPTPSGGFLLGWIPKPRTHWKRKFNFFWENDPFHLATAKAVHHGTQHINVSNFRCGVCQHITSHVDKSQSQISMTNLISRLTTTKQRKSTFVQKCVQKSPVCLQKSSIFPQMLPAHTSLPFFAARSCSWSPRKIGRAKEPYFSALYYTHKRALYHRKGRPLVHFSVTRK